jgi:hypothetical protein
MGGQIVQVFQSFLEAIMNIYVIFGASDPEAQKARELCRECNVPYGQAIIESREVEPANAYDADGWRDETGELRPGARVLLFECDGAEMILKFPDGTCYTRLDHHKPGDRGWGWPPSDFWRASSLGQLAAELARAGVLCGDANTDAGNTPLGVRKWDESSGTWRVATLQARWWIVPTHYLYAAAADHCLAAAYRGKCTGVDPDALMRWRVEQRAKFQNRPVDAVLDDIEKARERLRRAINWPSGDQAIVWYDGQGYGSRLRVTPPLRAHPNGLPYQAIGAMKVHTSPVTLIEEAERLCRDGYVKMLFADLRGEEIPELPEAAAREGIPFVASVRDRDGREKIVLQAAPSILVQQFMSGEIIPGLVDVYGDPARGFAGGYIPA